MIRRDIILHAHVPAPPGCLPVRLDTPILVTLWNVAVDLRKRRIDPGTGNEVNASYSLGRRKMCSGR